MKDIDTWELYWLSILKMTLLTRTSVLIVGVYKGTIVNLETAGIREYRHRGRKTDRHWSRKLLKARRVNAVTNCDSLRLVPNSSYAPPSTTSSLPGNREDWNMWTDKKISGTENVTRLPPSFLVWNFVWKCCEWRAWPRANDDNILPNYSPWHFFSQQFREE